MGKDLTFAHVLLLFTITPINLYVKVSVVVTPPSLLYVVDDAS